MTGYGKAVAELDGGRLTVEIRSVNGKSADVSVKSSLLPKDKDIEVRRRLADRLVRGTIDLFLTWEPAAAQSAKKINTALASEYYRQISELASAISQPSSAINQPAEVPFADVLSTILRMPDVVDAGSSQIITETNWPLVSGAIDKALDEIDRYRSDEGVSLYKDVTGRVETILSLYDEVEKFAPQRVQAVREKILKAAEDLKVKLDAERFEQEMIFYLEKLDINEEKVRLRQHCKYFFETIDGEPCPGKKLGFIIQEMGREINTTGSKANHAEIQKCVVKMKDELEKIREQSMNIL